MPTTGLARRLSSGGKDKRVAKLSRLDKKLAELEAARDRLDASIQVLRDLKQTEVKPKKPRAVKPRIVEAG